MPMTADEIRAAVQADPELLALAQSRDTTEIAARLSVGRKRVVPLRMTETEVMSALGVTDGEAFLSALETFGTKILSPAHPLKAAQPGIKRMVRWLTLAGTGGGIDVGNLLSRQLLDTMAAAGELTTASVATIKARAEQPDPVPEWDVRIALIADDGSLRV